MKVIIEHFKLWERRHHNESVRARFTAYLPELGLKLTGLQLVYDHRGWTVLTSAACLPDTRVRIAWVEPDGALELPIRKAAVAALRARLKEVA
ncbi:hypothetical protein [Rhizobium sp. IMFF44]|uniref:hypothetical protein n=1 Tax=Rhizobium sp. IMFF44 TaxID=3342350 RepID=UPI0035BAAE99